MYLTIKLMMVHIKCGFFYRGSEGEGRVVGPSPDEEWLPVCQPWAGRPNGNSDHLWNNHN